MIDTLFITAGRKELSKISSRLSECKKMYLAQGTAIWLGKIDSFTVGACLCGIGPEKTEQSLRKLPDNFSCNRVIVAGVCGALKIEIPCGTVSAAQSVMAEWMEGSFINLSPAKLNAFSNTELQFVEENYLTVRQPLTDGDAAERLVREYNVGCVDMESWVIADYFAARSIPVYIVKAVSDHADKNAELEFVEWQDRAADNSAKAALALAKLQ